MLDVFPNNFHDGVVDIHPTSQNMLNKARFEIIAQGAHPSRVAGEKSAENGRCSNFSKIMLIWTRFCGFQLGCSVRNLLTKSWESDAFPKGEIIPKRHI